MDLLDAIYNRRSIRKFSDKEVPNDDLYVILDAARWAPSACNQQLWHFIIVKNKETKKKIVKEAGSTALILRSPVLVVVTYRKDNIEEGYQSASAAVENMILAATDLGIGSVWLNSIGKKTKIKRILKIPQDQIIICFVLFGYAKKDIKNAPPRKPLENIVHKEFFRSSIASPKFFHDTAKWTLQDIKNYQRYYCRKTDLGTEMDVVNKHEKKIIQMALRDVDGALLDLFSYDGSLLQYFPEVDSLYTLDLTDQTSLYTMSATKKRVNSLIYEDGIPLGDNSIATVTCLYKLERIPEINHFKLFNEVARVLNENGNFILLFRETYSLYHLLYTFLKIILKDDIRKTGIYSFFGPYKPLNSRKTAKELERAGFKVDTVNYFIIPPTCEDFYHLFLQYMISGGSSFLHRIKHEDALSKTLEKIFDIQNLKKSKIGSTALLTAKKSMNTKIIYKRRQQI
jgi:nitroreductase